MQGVFDDLSGQSFGNVIVLPHSKVMDNRGRKWLVRCLCDKATEWWAWAEIIKREPNICCRNCRNKAIGLTKNAQKGQFARIHGWATLDENLKQPKTYRAWQGAKQRVGNPNFPRYDRYGGRGIKMCLGWWNSFESFFASVGLAPFKHWSLGRINNDGHYSCGKCEECLKNGWPLNVRWEPPRTQSNNRSTNRMLTYGGRTQSISLWAIELGLSRECLNSRLRKGLPVDVVLFQNPIDKGNVLFYSSNC